MSIYFDRFKGKVRLKLHSDKLICRPTILAHVTEAWLCYRTTEWGTQQ